MNSSLSFDVCLSLSFGNFLSSLFVKFSEMHVLAIFYFLIFFLGTRLDRLNMS